MGERGQAVPLFPTAPTEAEVMVVQLRPEHPCFHEEDDTLNSDVWFGECVMENGRGML